MRTAIALLRVLAVLATLYVAAWTAVVSALLRRGHRWVPTMVPVFATLTALGRVLAVVQRVVHATTGVVLRSDVAPSLLTVGYVLVSTALCTGVLALLFRPVSRRWSDQRTAWRRWAAQQRRAGQGGAHERRAGSREPDGEAPTGSG